MKWVGKIPTKRGGIPPQISFNLIGSLKIIKEFYKKLSKELYTSLC